MLLAAMRRRQASRRGARFAAAPTPLWDHPASFSRHHRPEGGSKDAPEPEPFPRPQPPPGEKPYPWRRLRPARSESRVAVTRARAGGDVPPRARVRAERRGRGHRAPPHAHVRPLRGAHAPLGAAAGGGALAAELSSLRGPFAGRRFRTVGERGWRTVRRSSPRPRARELACPGEPRRGGCRRDGVRGGGGALVGARGALQGAAVPVQAVGGWAALGGGGEAARRRRASPCRRSRRRTRAALRARRVWSESYVDDLRGICASLGRDGLNFHQETSAAARSALCGVEEISEEKVLAHIAEAVRLFVKGGHLEAAVRAAKVALPAWERRRAFGDLARAHTGIAGVYRFLHQVPPAGAAGSGSFGMLPPPPGPPPPPATYYRVRLVGTAWDELDGRTWVHREPRDGPSATCSAGCKVTGGQLPRRTPITPLPANGGDGAHEGKAHVHIIAVEPVYSAMDDDASNSHRTHRQTLRRLPSFRPDAGGNFRRLRRLSLASASFRAAGVPSHRGRGCAAHHVALRTTARVDGKFPGLCARLLVTDESTTEMSRRHPRLRCSSSRRAISGGDGWDERETAPRAVPSSAWSAA